MSRYYYAAYHTHSIRFWNDVAYIIRFGSKGERDAYVSDEMWDGNGWHREVITRARARSLAPDAFRVVDFGRCMHDWVSDGHPGEFFTIHDLC